MVDSEGFRENVGIILTNSDNRLFWARRIRQLGWQFPQGGILTAEDIESALYRELYEEVGLKSEHVEILTTTKDWLSYRLPDHLIRHSQLPLVIGQKQKWYLLRLTAEVSNIRLDTSDRPEFDQWCWVDYWYPLEAVVSFKREVYKGVLTEFAPILHQES